MHLMQHLSHHYVNKHLSRLTYGRAPAKRSNPVVIRNRRIDMIEVMDVLLSSAINLSNMFPEMDRFI